MSKFIEDALNRVNDTEFIYDADRHRLEIRNGVLVYTNFSGRPNQFGNESKNFNIVIPENLKNQIDNNLFGLKVNINHVGGKEPDEPILYFFNVKVNMLVEFPPAVTLFTDYNGQKSKNSLDDATIGCLDRVDMARCDIVVNVKEAKKTRPGWAVFYLKQFNCIQYKNPEFGGAYAEWDDPCEETNDELLEQNRDVIENN